LIPNWKGHCSIFHNRLSNLIAICGASQRIRQQTEKSLNYSPAATGSFGHDDDNEAWLPWNKSTCLWCRHCHIQTLSYSHVACGDTMYSNSKETNMR